MRRAKVSHPITPSLMSIETSVEEKAPYLICFDVYRSDQTVEFWSLDLRKSWLEQDDLAEVSPHLTAFEYSQVESRMRTQFEASREVYLQFTKQKLRLLS